MWFTYNSIPHVFIQEKRTYWWILWAAELAYIFECWQVVSPLLLNKLFQVNSKGLFYQNFDSLILKCPLSSMQSIQRGETSLYIGLGWNLRGGSAIRIALLCTYKIILNPIHHTNVEITTQLLNWVHLGDFQKHMLLKTRSYQDS